MPALVPPDPRYHRSFLEAGSEESHPVHLFRGSEPDLGHPLRFANYVAALLADADPGSPRPPGYVPATTVWWVDGETYLGRVSIRHTLNDTLRTVGGHIGYWIRPSARGRGHGREAFRASLPLAAALGIDPALLTCDEDNLASRRIIEGAGGAFESRFDVKRRYWVPTQPEGRDREHGGQHAAAV